VRRRRKSNFGKLIFFIFVVVLLLIGLSKIKGSNKPKLASGVVSPISQTAVLGEDVANNRLNANLENYIAKIPSLDTKNFGVAAISLETGEEAFINPNMSFPAASLYKLWVMAVVFEQIEKGQFSLKTNLSKNVTDLNQEFNLDKDVAEKTSGVVSETVEEALNQMITISDNYSALLLVDQIGVNSIQKFLTNNGLTSSHVSQNGKLPETTAYDTALFFYKLYNGEFGNSVTTTNMITLLGKQALNEKLPKYLPESLIIAHKTGEIDEYSHDAGIIYTPDTRYILVVLTKSSDTDAAKEDIAEISKNIYEYFER